MSVSHLKPQDLALTLQRVVCPAGLRPSELTVRLDDLRPLTQLECVHARMQGQQPLDCARAIVSVVREALTRLEDGPSRRAVELLLGAGTTWGLLRKDRRKAAADTLAVGEVHYRKYRELPLLMELAEQVCALEAECAAQRQQVGLPEVGEKASSEQDDDEQEIITAHASEPSRMRKRLWGAVMLPTIVSALVILIWTTRGARGPAGGTNGQQIMYCPAESIAHGKAVVTGANQDGIVILKHTVSLSSSCGLETGWWWVGNVEIAWYDSNDQYVGTTTCPIPRKQKSHDWVSCSALHARVASGGGCSTSPDGVLGACVSKNRRAQIVPDAYINGSHPGCTILVSLYDNGNYAGQQRYSFNGGGHFSGPVIGAAAGHDYDTVAILACADVHDTQGSPTQYA